VPGGKFLKYFIKPQQFAGSRNRRKRTPLLLFSQRDKKVPATTSKFALSIGAVRD